MSCGQKASIFAWIFDTIIWGGWQPRRHGDSQCCAKQNIWTMLNSLDEIFKRMINGLQWHSPIPVPVRLATNYNDNRRVSANTIYIQNPHDANQKFESLQDYSCRRHRPRLWQGAGRAHLRIVRRQSANTCDSIVPIWRPLINLWDRVCVTSHFELFAVKWRERRAPRFVTTK